MLKIRPEQDQALSAYMRESFVKRAAAHLRTAVPDKTAQMPEAELLEFVRRGTEHAEGYKVVIEWDVCRFLEYRMRYGATFDTSAKTPWIGETLRNPAYDGTSKMDRIEYRHRHESAAG